MADENETAETGGEGGGASEAAEIAALLDGLAEGEEGGEGGTPEGEAPPPAPPPPKADKPDKPDKERPTWKEIREKRKALDHRESDLEKRARLLEERERGLSEKAKRAELVERLASGDLDAATALGVDLNVLVEAQIAAARGEKPTPRRGEESQEAREIRELKDRLAQREQAEALARAEAEFEEQASADALLSKMPRGRRIELGHALAARLHAEGKPVPRPGEIPALLVKQLRQEYEAMRALFEVAQEAPSPASGNRTISRQDSKVRGGPRAPIRTDDDELAAITAALRG